jgi:hypothetical protein
MGCGEFFARSLTLKVPSWSAARTDDLIFAPEAFRKQKLALMNSISAREGVNLLHTPLAVSGGAGSEHQKLPRAISSLCVCRRRRRG